MRLVIQRVKRASVTIDSQIYSAIKEGIMVLVGIEGADTDEDAEWLSQKLLKMRIFDDQDGVMNLPLADIQGELLVISQFTLHASVKKGNRPSYIRAAAPEKANALYETFVNMLKEGNGGRVKTGVFGADMQVELINDGPVTITIDSRNKE